MDARDELGGLLAGVQPDLQHKLRLLGRQQHAELHFTGRPCSASVLHLLLCWSACQTLSTDFQCSYLALSILNFLGAFGESLPWSCAGAAHSGAA